MEVIMKRPWNFSVLAASMVVSIGLCSTRVLGEDADATASALDAAKATRDAALKDAEAALSKGLGETVKKIAATGKLDATKAALSAKDQFDKWHLVPHSAGVAEPVREFLKMREAANAKLATAYDDAEAGYTKQLKVDEATAVRAEKGRFVAAEKSFMQSFTTTKVAAQSQDPAPAKPDKVVNTGQYLAAISVALNARIDEIAKLDTSAKRDDAHTTMIQGADAWLETYTFTLRFPIKDVQHAVGGQFTFSLSQPAEVTGIKGSFTYMSTLTIDFPAEEVSKIKAGDILVVSGTPRMNGTQGIYAQAHSMQGTISPLSLRSDVSKYIYGIHFQNYKVTVEHAPEPNPKKPNGGQHGEAGTVQGAESRRNVEQIGGFSFVPPEGWDVRTVPGLKYKVVVGPVRDNLPANINIVDEPFKGSLDDYAKATVTAAQARFKKFRVVKEQEFKTAAGLPGVRLITEDEQKDKLLRQTFFIFSAADIIYVATASTVSEGGEKLDPIFEACLKSFRFEKK
jgi:hypothetical protein